MLLRDALEHGPLTSATLIAGQAHVDREITWAQVIDHPDIEPWVSEGHLLLSTGYTWPKDAEHAFSIVEKLAAKGVCGVVLAVPHFMAHFPKASVEAARKIGLPLMEIPWAIPFSVITQTIHRELVGQQARDLARSEQIHRELTEAAVSNDGLHQVARVLGHVLERNVWILAKDAQVLSFHAYDSEATEGLIPALPATLLERIRTLGIDSAAHPMRLRVETWPVAAGSSVVAYAVRVRLDCVGYVLVVEGASNLSALDLRAVEHAGTVTALQISHQRELAMQEARLGYALVASLIEGRFDETPASLERARLGGWDDASEYRLAAVLMDEPNPLSSEGFVKRESIAQRIRQALKLKEVPVLISVSANQVHVLLPQSIPVEWLWIELSAGRAAMAVSEAHQGVEGMKLAGREVFDLLEHVRPGRIHYFSEAIFPRVLSGDLAARKIFLYRLFGAMGPDKRGQQMLDTAIALTDEGFNLQRTADRLDIHISSLRYRVNKLAEMTGLDLETVEGRFRLQYGARLFVAERH